MFYSPIPYAMQSSHLHGGSYLVSSTKAKLIIFGNRVKSAIKLTGRPPHAKKNITSNAEFGDSFALPRSPKTSRHLKEPAQVEWRCSVVYHHGLRDLDRDSTGIAMNQLPMEYYFSSFLIKTMSGSYFCTLQRKCISVVLLLVARVSTSFRILSKRKPTAWPATK